MNEAVYRSPNWLKKYLDFEIHTGEDIKGKVSKKEIRDKAKAEEERIKKEWEKRWTSMDRDNFEKFYASEFPADYRSRRSCLLSSDFREIHDELFGNFDIWVKYDAWLKDKKDKENKQEEIKNELESLFKRIVDDFTNNPWDDKYRVTSNGNDVTFYYTFENGDKFEITDNRITYSGVVYTVGLLFRNKFISLANEITSKGSRRPGKRSNSWSGSSSGSRSGSSSNSSGSRKSTKSKYSDHPKGNLYQTLKDTVAQRKEQLSKMSKNDENRTHLENELKAAEKKLKEMKDKYQFENLVSFYDFK